MAKPALEGIAARRPPPAGIGTKLAHLWGELAYVEALGGRLEIRAVFPDDDTIVVRREIV